MGSRTLFSQMISKLILQNFDYLGIFIVLDISHAQFLTEILLMVGPYVVTQDVKQQLRFLEDLDKIEKKKHDEEEKELLFKAAKSRAKSDDPEKEKLKAKAKEMQSIEAERIR